MSKEKPVGAAAVPKAWDPPAGAVTYIGPELPGIPRMTTYEGGVPAALLELARDNCKALRALIVPTENIAAKLAAVKAEGTAEHALYAKAEKFAKGEE